MSRYLSSHSKLAFRPRRPDSNKNAKPVVIFMIPSHPSFIMSHNNALLLFVFYRLCLRPSTTMTLDLIN